MDQRSSEGENEEAADSQVWSRWLWSQRKMIAVVMVVLGVVAGIACAAIFVTREGGTQEGKVIGSTAAGPSQETAVTLDLANDGARSPLTRSDANVTLTATTPLVNEDEWQLSPAKEQDATTTTTITTTTPATPSSSSALLTNMMTTDKASLLSPSKTTCMVADAAELTLAVEVGTCSNVMLTSNAAGAYRLEREIIVSRPIRITGSAALLPLIDAHHTIRGFRVQAGGFLDLRYVRMKQGHGEIKDKWQLDGGLFGVGDGVLPPPQDQEKDGLSGVGDPTKVQEIRGASVLFEPGTMGGNFVGVIFIEAQEEPEDVLEAILQTMTGTSIRIYGGHVYVGAGAVRFFGCLFWDVEIITPLSDRIYIGGDVLVMGGVATFDACQWYYTTLFGAENGAGFNVAVMGGAAIFNFCVFQEQNGISAENGIGQVFYVAGGVMIVTGCDFRFFGAAEFFSGVADWTVTAGVLVMTGVNVYDFFALLAAWGAGFEFAVGAGVLVQVGTVFYCFTGDSVQALAGGVSFLGTGTMVLVGCPQFCHFAVGSEFGVGGVAWNGAGVSVIVGSPVFENGAIWAFFGLGEFYAVGAGHMTLYACPFFETTAIEYFNGLGGAVWVGAGAATMGLTPITENIAIKNEHNDFWIQGSCEPGHGAWAGGPLFTITGGLGCKIDEHEEEGGDGAADHEEGAGDEHDDHRERKAATIHSGNRERSLGGSLPSSTNSLVMKDIVKRKWTTSSGAWDHLLPADMVKATAILKEQIAQINSDVTGQESPSSSIIDVTVGSPTVHVDSPLSGYCGICGIDSDSLSGPGSTSCEVEESCKDLDVPKEAQGFITTNGTALNFQTQYILSGSIDTTIPWGTTLNNTECEKAMLIAINNYFSDDAKLSVYNRRCDPLYQQFQPDARCAMDLIYKPGQPLPKHYQVSLVTNKKSTYEELLEVFKNQPSPFNHELQSILMNLTNVEVGELFYALEWSYVVPAYNSEAMMASNPAANLGDYIVVLLDPDQPAVPLKMVKYNKKYTVHLEGFPPGTKVNIKATKVESTLLMGNKNIIVNMGDHVMDETGQAAVAHTFPITMPSGDYYLTATEELSGDYAMSPLYEISYKRQKRRAYGPILRA